MYLSDIQINKDNFAGMTLAQWSQVKEMPTREPDKVSGEGFSKSFYWFEDDMVIRTSNHWFEVAFCSWPVRRLLPGSRIKFAKGDDPRFKSILAYEDGENVRITCAAFWSDFSWRDLSYDEQMRCSEYMGRVGNTKASELINPKNNK